MLNYVCIKSSVSDPLFSADPDPGIKGKNEIFSVSFHVSDDSVFFRLKIA